MKIAYLTAGAAGMFCGSCLNDNALARALIAQGHDCLLIPAYTPIRTDDEDVSIDRVFLGGINVYLQQKMPWLSYTPRWLDSILNQSWLISSLTKNAGKTSPVLLGALAVSMLQGLHGRQRKEFARLLAWLKQDVQPETVVFTNLLIGGFIPDLRKELGCSVFVTLQGDDIFLDSIPEKYRKQAIASMQSLVAHVDGFITHSHAYAQTMGTMLNIPSDKMHVVPLAIPVADFKLPSHKADARIPERKTIGYLARMAPEKGLHNMVDAFITLAASDPKVYLKMAGWMGPQHEEFWSEQRRKLSNAELDGRWEYVGSVDRDGKTEFLHSLDLFCVPTTYAEPKGLFLLEAVATGLHYVQPNHGAFPELHERLGRGWLYRHDSMTDLVEKLRTALHHPLDNKAPSASLLEEIDIATHARRIASILK